MFGAHAAEHERTATAFRDASAAFDQGVEAQIHGDHERALGAYLRAIELDPAQPESYTNAAVAKFCLGDDGAAARLLRKALQIDPVNRVTSWNVSGMGLRIEDHRAANE